MKSNHSKGEVNDGRNRGKSGQEFQEFIEKIHRWGKKKNLVKIIKTKKWKEISR